MVIIWLGFGLKILVIWYKWLNDGLEIGAALSCAGQHKAQYNIRGLDIILSYIYLLLRMYYTHNPVVYEKMLN
jgi:hypothetical protein